MNATTFAPRPEPHRRAPAPATRPDLRLVDPADVRARRRTRLVTGTLIVAVFAGLFSIVATRVLLAQGQVEVDRLTASVEAKQTARQELRLTVAELEAPAQITAAARQRLGMVTPTSVTYLAPLPRLTAGAPGR